MSLRSEFCNCERFYVETEGDAYTFDLVVLAGRRMLCVNRGFNFREFRLDDDISFVDVDANTILARSGNLSVSGTVQFNAPRTGAYGQYIPTHLMRQSEIYYLTALFDEETLASLKSPALYVSPKPDGDCYLHLLDGDTLVATVTLWDDIIELAGLSFDT